jgi:hypothetical protein
VRNTLMLALILLISAMLLQAQDSGQASGNNASPTTLEGCLTYSAGHYRLTDSSGMVYQLSNQANKLTKHVGHQVKLTGKPGIRTIDTTIQGGASSAKEQHVFKVNTVEHVAETCGPPAK